MPHSLRDPLLTESIIPILVNSSVSLGKELWQLFTSFVLLSWHVLSLYFSCSRPAKDSKRLYNKCTSSMETIWRSVAVRNTARYGVWKRKKTDRMEAYWKHMWGISLLSSALHSSPCSRAGYELVLFILVQFIATHCLVCAIVLCDSWQSEMMLLLLGQWTRKFPMIRQMVLPFEVLGSHRCY